MSRYPFRSASRFPTRIAGLAILTGLAILVASLGLASVASAQTMPLPADDAGYTGAFPSGDGTRGMRLDWPSGRVNPMFELDQIVRFLDLWQERSPGPDFGGMIEAEGGLLGDVIQTDNTLEAIWVWSHYTDLTGSTEYLDNIADAWTYCLNYPPWLEEGGNGYYRVHNAAWGLTAESRYRETTGDESFLGFASTCANYIVTTPLFLNQYQKLNAFCQAWAAGNLYLYGEEMANSGWMGAAVDYGHAMMDWIAIDPPLLLATEFWAMSSGTVVWGICNSAFRDDPLLGQQWIGQHGALVDTFQVWYDVPGDSYDWDNSWNVAYVNAHFAMGDITGDPYYTGMGEKITRQLLSYDTDDDGGIQGTTQDPDTEDMSWVTCYLAKFGVARLLGTPPSRDAGILRFRDMADGDTVIVGDVPLPILVEASNFGLDALTGVEVHLEGAEIGQTVIDLDFVEREIVELHPGWFPSPGEYEFLAYTVVPGDEDASNDSLRIRVTVPDLTHVSEGPLASAETIGPVWPNPAAGDSRIALRIPSSTPASLAIYSIDGRAVAAFEIVSGAARTETIVWDGRDASGRRVAAGLYLAAAHVGDQTHTARIVRVE